MNRRRKRIGIVTEGDAEVASLPLIYEQIQARTGTVLIRPLRANVDPLSPVPVLARGLVERVRLAQQNSDIVLVLLDRENHPDSAGKRALDIQQALSRLISGDVFVVVKDCKYENWLVATPESFEAQRGRFPAHARIRAVAAGGADRVGDATRLINSAVVRSSQYEKVHDSKRILSRAVVESMATNSRSFRRFLGLAGDPLYATGSRTHIPAP